MENIGWIPELAHRGSSHYKLTNANRSSSYSVGFQALQELTVYIE